MPITSSPDASLRALASYPPRIFRWVVDAALAAAIAAFALLFILQFTHSPKLLHLSWIARLKQVGDPLIAEVRSWTGLDWPVDTGFSFIPLAMAFLIWWVKIGMDGLFLKAGMALSRPPRTSLEPAAGGNSTRTRITSGATGSHQQVRNP